MTCHCIEDKGKKRLKITLDAAILYKNAKRVEERKKNNQLLATSILYCCQRLSSWTGSILYTNMTLIVIELN